MTLNDTLRTLLKFNCQFLRRGLEGLDDAALDAPMAPGANSGRWVLIHLAVSLDLALLSYGKKGLLPREMLVQYGPGSSGEVPAGAPSVREAVAMIDAAEVALDVALVELGDPAVQGAMEERFARAHAARALQGTPLESIGQAFSHLLTTHFAMHLGQLSLVRRRHGLPAMM